ncbi:MAG: HesA/MoeB/ThiF family protein [Paludibacter sp.]|nr:HesA/MoeB/ThiF family protein [Paludibacter sp.]
MILTNKEKEVYSWQIDVPDFGEEGQIKLKESSVLISRCGGLGGIVAYELAAAGIGNLVLAHNGNIQDNDLNRQLLMTDQALGTSRVESAKKRLLDLNPRLNIEIINENITASNAASIVSKVNLIVDAAPLFEERFNMNLQSVLQNKPMIDCAMYELEAQITTFIPGETPCLSCLYPENPPHWKRRFPVFGAVSGVVGCLGAMEVIKVLAGFGEVLAGKLLLMDYRQNTFETVTILKNPTCNVCGKH